MQRLRRGYSPAAIHIEDLIYHISGLGKGEIYTILFSLFYFFLLFSFASFSL